MKKKNVIPIIMSGGSGTRAWPLSRSEYPKQFIPFFGNKTLFQQTLNRIKSFDKAIFKDPIIVGNKNHKHFIANDIKECGIDISSIILEPCPQNTAPALTAGCLVAIDSHSEDDYFLAMPSDHLIKDEKAFHTAIQRGIEIVNKDSIVLFGIEPDKPHTGYGYIQHAEKSDDYFKAIRFTEKPDVLEARKFFNSGNYLWNGGIFLINIKFFISLIKQQDEALLKHCEASLGSSLRTHNFVELDEGNFSKLNSTSIDYLIMNKIEEMGIDTKVIPMDIGWNDLGSLDSFWDSSEKDLDGNVLFGEVVAKDTKNSLLYSDYKTLTSIGMKDTVLINTPDAVLIAHKDKSEEVKEFINQIKKKNSEVTISPRKVTRPWGTYDSIDETKNSKVKRIVVASGQKLSKQSHKNRSETWVVVSGEAKVTLDDKKFILKKEESIFIPSGTVHRLENARSYPLELIEIQTGTYFGEDDITRYEDDYGRK